MNEALLISNVILWLLVVGLACVVAALTRQVGLLHERIAPVGALAVERGPEVGEQAPSLAALDLSGRSVPLGGRDAHGRCTLLFFLSPTCPVCKTLLPTLKRMLRDEAGNLRLVYASDGEANEHSGFVRQNGLDEAEYLLSEELGRRFAVAKLPFAVLIDAQGTIRAKGMVNTREHLESLFEADRLGVASVQQYLELQHTSPDGSSAEHPRMS